MRRGAHDTHVIETLSFGEEIVQSLCTLARTAGANLRTFLEDQRSLGLVEKGPRDFVTEADKESDAVLKAGLKRILPNASVVSEEDVTTRRGIGVECLIDPLDGTTNYAHRHPFYSISLAVTVDGEPIIGIVYAPHFDELFLATAGQGAYLNGRPIGVSNVSRSSDALFCAGFSVRSAASSAAAYGRAWAIAHAVRHDGSAALDLAFVAAGRYDGFWERSLRPWDTAAGLLLVREAGGIVNGFAGAAFDLDEGSIIASNRLLASELAHIVGH